MSHLGLVVLSMGLYFLIWLISCRAKFIIDTLNCSCSAVGQEAITTAMPSTLTPESATIFDICFSASNWFFAPSVPASFGDNWGAATALATTCFLPDTIDLGAHGACLPDLIGRIFILERVKTKCRTNDLLQAPDLVRVTKY